jgi:hypothetical protein
MPDHQGDDVFVVELRARPDSRVPGTQRLKALLKYAGRHLGLTCLSAVRVKHDGAAEPTGPRAEEQHDTAATAR